MPDPRFYAKLGPRSLADIANLTKARLDSVEAGLVLVDTVSGLDADKPGALSFLERKNHARALDHAVAAACFLREADAERARDVGVVPLITEHPQAAFAVAVRALFAVREADAEGPAADIAPSARLGPGVVVGAGARIGADVVIGANSVIGPGVSIGEAVRIGANAVVQFADIGARSVIGAGAVIGDTGFSLAAGPNGLADVPHLGLVRIAADVSVGANTTIDRAIFDATEIGEGSKIDNLVQIAHNVRIGRHCILAGCCGLSGSVVVEDGAILGGSVGVADHCTIGAGAKLAGATLVMRDVPPGETWAGTPAKPIRAFFREVAALAKLAQKSGG